MRRKLSLILTLTAWLFATGSHWDLVQTYAWGSMIAGYTQEMSFSAAVKKTFSAETMCRLCHAVADAKKSTGNDATIPEIKTPGKILLISAPTRIALFDPALPGLSVMPLLTVPSSADRAAPPFPPPRLFA